MPEYCIERRKKKKIKLVKSQMEKKNRTRNESVHPVFQRNQVKKTKSKCFHTFNCIYMCTCTNLHLFTFLKKQKRVKNKKSLSMLSRRKPSSSSTRHLVIATVTTSTMTPLLISSSRFIYVAKPGDTADPSKQHQIPDRLRDAFAFYGADVTRAEPEDNDQDIPYRSPDQRQQMMQGLLGMHSHTISLTTIDKVRIALDGVKRKPPEHEDWSFLNSLLRNSDMCLELVPEPTDVFPAGDKCWVHLSETQVRRKPYVLHFRECGNSFCVLPVFTQEEYLTHYFQRMKAHDATWFPMPRMGSQRKEFMKNKFPVCAHGPLAKLAALAVSLRPQGPDETFVMCINPFQSSSKFITYNEMVRLSKLTPKEKKEQELYEKRKQMNPFGKALEGKAMLPRGAPQQQQQQQQQQPDQMSMGPGNNSPLKQQQLQQQRELQQMKEERQKQKDEQVLEAKNARELESQQQQLKMQMQHMHKPQEQQQQPESVESFFMKMEKQKDKMRKQQEKMLGFMKKSDEAAASNGGGGSESENKKENQKEKETSTATADEPDFEVEAPTTPVEQTDLGKMYVHGLNERDRITRDTLRRVKLQKVIASDGSTSADLHFSKIFDTSKWVGRRITPDEAIEYARGDIAFPETDDLCVKVERNVPTLGKTVEQELQESEEELQKSLEEQRRKKEERKKRSISEIDPNEPEENDDEHLNKHSHKIKNLGFAMDTLREKFPQFNQLRKPPKPRPKEPRPVTAEMLRHKLNQEAVEAVVGARPVAPGSDEEAANKLKPHWVFPVVVPVTRQQREEQERMKLSQKSLVPIRIPRIAHDELMLLLFDIPHVKLVVATIVRSSEDPTKFKLLISLVTTDPLVLLEEIVKREKEDYEEALKQAGDKTLLATENAGEKMKEVLNKERAEKLTSEIEIAGADGRARVELSWSFPKNKSNTPYPIEFANMTTTEWADKIIKDNFASAYAILYDRTARHSLDLEEAKVIGRPSLREELDYDGEDIDVTEWHKPDRPFWGLS